MSRNEYVCSAVFHPLANALADCHTCGWPISRHHSSETTMQLYEKGPFGPEDTGSIESLRAALQKRVQEVAELEKLAAMRLEEINEIKRTREQERDYADVCYRNEQLSKQIHAANNEIMAARLERNELKARIEAMEVADSMKTYEINVLTRENRQLDKRVKAADRQLLALRSEVEVKP